jgi:hypothetical protein
MMRLRKAESWSIVNEFGLKSTVFGLRSPGLAPSRTRGHRHAGRSGVEKMLSATDEKLKDKTKAPAGKVARTAPELSHPQQYRAQ